MATDPVEHHRQRYSSNIATRLMHGSKWHWQQSRKLDVVNPYDSDIFRDALIERHQRVHQMPSGNIVGTQEGVHSIPRQQAFDKAGVRWIA